jgi:hypothetical protein
LTVYSTVKGTLRTQKALRRSEEMDLFFLGPTTGQRAVPHLIPLANSCGKKFDGMHDTALSYYLR